MANSRHYLNGQQVEEPENWQQFKVVASWEKGKIDATIKLDNLLFKGQSATDIQEILNTKGYFEGIPYDIEVGEPLNPVLTYNGYLDATDEPTIIAPNIIAIALKKLQGEDWMKENAESFSYRYLASDSYNGAGKITSSDYSGVPYVINYIPDGVELLLLSISTFMLTKELVESIQSIAEQTTDLINGVTPVVGQSVGLGAGAVTAWDLGDIIAAVINLAVTVAYTVGIIVALVKLTEQIIDQLAPKKRYHLGMTVRQLFQKGCDYLGYTLKSDLLDAIDTSANKWVVIPKKGHKGGSPPTGADTGSWVETGVPTKEDGIDNLGDAIRVYSSVFNADYRIRDGVFEFEREDYWDNNSSYVVPDTLTDQTDLTNPYTVNTSAIKANFEILWDTDQQDMNTLDNSQGRAYQVITSPKTVTNPELVNIKGLETINVPLSMAVRKDKLTVIEEALKIFLQAADFLSGQLGQPNSFAGQFSARVGAMHLSSHFTSRPKMVVMAGNSLALDQREILSAKNLWEKYHFLKSFVTIKDKNAQRLIVKDKQIPFCFENFVSLSNNNVVEDAEGNKVKILELDWSYEEGHATISYEIESVYDDKLKVTFIE